MSDAQGFTLSLPSAVLLLAFWVYLCDALRLSQSAAEVNRISRGEIYFIDKV